jgi:hypothetical protein
MRGAAVGVMGTSDDEVDLPFCPAAAPPPLVLPEVVEVEIDPPDVVVLEVLEVLEVLSPSVLLVVVVVCWPDCVLTPPVPRAAALRRLSAVAASPSDWLYAVNGASVHNTATAQIVWVRMRMGGAPP